MHQESWFQHVAVRWGRTRVTASAAGFAEACEGRLCCPHLTSCFPLCNATVGNQGTVPCWPDSAYVSPVMINTLQGLWNCVDLRERMWNGREGGVRGNSAERERGPSAACVASSQHLSLRRALKPLRSSNAWKAIWARIRLETTAVASPLFYHVLRDNNWVCYKTR